MSKRELTIVSMERDFTFSLEEVCDVCHITPDFIQELIDYGVLDSTQSFEGLHVRLIRRVLHLQHDLQINLPGAALAIELKNQIETLQEEVSVLKKYLKSSEK